MWSEEEAQEAHHCAWHTSTFRLIPSNKLAREITETYLKDAISSQDEVKLKTIEEMSITVREDIYQKIFGDESDVEQEEELKPIGKAASLFTKMLVGDPEMDIGECTTEHNKSPDTKLSSTNQETLNEIYKVVGSKQLTRRKMSSAPSWILDSALKEELDANWSETFDKVDERKIGDNSKVIPSHVVYKVKSGGNKVKRMKAQICPNGNRDRMKKSVHKDSATAQFDIIRLILSLASILLFRLGCIYINSAYLQSSPIKRRIYVRPPRELGLPRHILCKLKKLPYGITEAGREWAKEIESWLIKKSGFKRVKVLSHFYVKRNRRGNIVMVVVKVTDDILVAGSIPVITAFSKEIFRRYKVR